MFWSLLFAVGIAQGCFLMFVFARRKNANRPAAAFLIALLGLFALSNFDDLLLSTGWFRAAPVLFGWSLAAIFAYGPLFWFYLRAATEPDFRWRRRYGWHFVPAVLFYLLYLPFIFWPAAPKIKMLETLLAGHSANTTAGTVIGIVRIAHLLVYLALAFGVVKKWVNALPQPFAESTGRQTRMLRFLLFTFVAYWLAVVVLFSHSALTGFFSIRAMGVFTVFSSSVLYVLSYTLMLDPAALTPAFPKKNALLRDPAADRDLLERLERAMREGKIFTDPDLKLASLAARLDVPPHRLSALINETFGESFSDFIARRRVEEFVGRLADPRSAHLSLHGLALEVGFNSKSAFNAAFKKITGKNPSDFKK